MSKSKSAKAWELLMRNAERNRLKVETAVLESVASMSDAVRGTRVPRETQARMTAAYRGEGMSFEDDGSPEHDD